MSLTFSSSQLRALACRGGGRGVAPGWWLTLWWFVGSSPGALGVVGPPTDGTHPRVVLGFSSGAGAGPPHGASPLVTAKTERLRAKGSSFHPQAPPFSGARTRGEEPRPSVYPPTRSSIICHLPIIYLCLSIISVYLSSMHHLYLFIMIVVCVSSLSVSVHLSSISLPSTDHLSLSNLSSIYFLSLYHLYVPIICLSIISIY